MGFFFGAGWSPCVRATLGAILTLALNEATVERGALLLFGCSMGLRISFLLMAFGVGRAAGILRRGRRAMRVVTIIGWLVQWAPPFDLGIYETMTTWR
ncbi:MAG: hypothetical protein ISS49_16015 [Anaerolineae bacterium]|nr:hypothetical protein [Anaerolineae bacterium]